MNTFHLSYNEIAKLVPFKFEEITPPNNLIITQLSPGQLFFENERWLGLSGCGGILQSVKLVNQRYLISFKNLSFTWRDTDINVYCPGVYRQLSGKNAGRLFYFPFYESWRHTTNSYDSIKKSLENEKRWFLPTYINC